VYTFVREAQLSRTEPDHGHGYRVAIADLENEQDPRRELRRREELYRRAEHLTGAMARRLHRIWYAVRRTN
jgi:hypothetical protein